MQQQHQHALTCPKCGSPFETSSWATADITDDLATLQRLLSEPEPLHVCPKCGVRVGLAYSFTVLDRPRLLLAHVDIFGRPEPVYQSLKTAVEKWHIEAPGAVPGRPYYVRGRLALKHLLLRSTNFSPDVVAQIPPEDCVNILLLWSDEWSREEVGDAPRALLSDAVVIALAEALRRSTENLSPTQVPLRSLCLQLHEWDARVPEMPSTPKEELVEHQAQLLEALVSRAPDEWEAVLQAHLGIAHPIIIPLCWRQATRYRQHPGGQEGAVALSQLSFWLAQRIGTCYQRAESAYHLAVSCQVAGYVEEAVSDYEEAIRLYLDALCWHQPLECYKHLGDLCLASEDRAAAQQWYKEGIGLAELWGMPEHIAPMAVNLSTVAIQLGDFARAETAARQTLIYAGREKPEDIQTRSIAYLNLRRALEEAGDRSGTVDAVRQAAAELSALQDWRTYAYVADELVKSAIKAQEWDLAEEILAEVLAHLDETEPAALGLLQPDRPQLLLGEADPHQRLKLMRMGAMTALLSGRARLSLSRFAEAHELARGNVPPDVEADILHQWASAHRKAGEVEESLRREEEALTLLTDEEVLVDYCEEAVLDHIRFALNGPPLEIDSLPSQDDPENRLASLRAATAYFDRAAALYRQSGQVDEGRLTDLAWQQSAATGHVAWTLRRTGQWMNEAVEVAALALTSAERSGEATARLQALDILYMCQRDAGQLQQAAQTFHTLVGLLVSSEPPSIRDVDGQPFPSEEATPFRRWVESASRLPGVGTWIDETGRYLTRSLPEDEEALMRWMANAARLPALALLSIREHRRELTREQLQRIHDSKSVFIGMGSLAALGNLDPEGMSWHMWGMSEQAGSPSMNAVPERWLDKVITGYLMLAGSADQRERWPDPAEWDRWAAQAYDWIAFGYLSLGMGRLGLQHGLRPFPLPQPDSPAGRWLPARREVASFPNSWNLTVTIAFKNGDRDVASQVVDAALEQLRHGSDLKEVIRFRIWRVYALMTQGDWTEFAREKESCREALSQIPDEQEREKLAHWMNSLDRVRQENRLGEMERRLLDARYAQATDQPVQDLEGEVLRLASLASAQEEFGNLDESRSVADRAAALAARTGVGKLEVESHIARARVEYANRNFPEAVMLLEQCLTHVERMIEPDPTMAGRVLGLLGVYRSTLARARIHGVRSLYCNTFLAPNDESPELARALEELERSLDIHRQLGTWGDVVTNLINIANVHMTYSRLDRGLACYLEALEVCAEERPGEAVRVHFPEKCWKVWVNVASCCNLLSWFPETAAIAEYSLTTLSDLLRGLVVDDNRLHTLPEREEFVPFAIEVMWRWIRDPVIVAADAPYAGPAWDELRRIRDGVRGACRKYGIVLDDRRPADSLPGSDRRTLYKKGRLLQRMVNTLRGIADPPDRPPQEGNTSRRRQRLYELVESSKSQVLHEQLGAILPVSPLLPTELRERERAAYEAWSRARGDCVAPLGSGVSVEEIFETCRVRYCELEQVWSEMEAASDSLAEYARLRSGRNLDYEIIRRCLA
jgi:tetratricopeptide (TPR) repeat protein